MRVPNRVAFLALALPLLLVAGCEWISRPATDPEETPDAAGSSIAPVSDAADTSTVHSEPTEPTPAETGLVVDLPPEERARLTDEAERDLAHSQEVVRAWSDQTGLTEEMAARLRTIRDYMGMAREALDEGDVQGASNLALKARLLAQEMGTP